MLVNLSNHPSANWPENQKAKARYDYSGIVDLPFPSIDPNLTSIQVIELADEYFAQCKKLLANSDVSNAVHIMGEFTFCYALVSRLRKAHITCIASTTKRIVKQEGSTKKSVFEFVDFRTFE